MTVENSTAVTELSIETDNLAELTKLLEEAHGKLISKIASLDRVVPYILIQHKNTTLAEKDLLKIIDNKLEQHFAVEARMCYLIHNKIYALQNKYETVEYFDSREIITNTLDEGRKRIKRIIQAISL